MRDANKDEVRQFLDAYNYIQYVPMKNNGSDKELTVVTNTLNVRKGSSMDYDVITTVSSGQSFLILAEKDGWYQINVDGDIGWVSGSPSYVSVRYIEEWDDIQSLIITKDSAPLKETTSDSSKSIDTLKKDQIYIILAKYENWFKINANGKIGWVKSSDSSITNAVPIEMFQFLVLSEDLGMSAKSINIELQGKGILEGHGQAFANAAKNHSLNEAYLLAHAFLETGHGTSALAQGIRVEEVDGEAVTPRIVYNMFGIGAFTGSANKSGSERAYKEGWFTPEAAIEGGAYWIGKNYINSELYQQDTLYKMRWNPADPDGWHQYATDIGWAYKQTRMLNLQNEILFRNPDLQVKFDIPIYMDHYHPLSTTWKKIDGKWYLLDNDNNKLTGWHVVDGKQYYLDKNGVMQTGWKKIDNNWYYFEQSGAMATGWKQSKGKWYYLNSSGVMQRGWIKTAGKWYYLDDSGAMLTGWIELDDKRYYLDDSGAMLTGWIEVDGEWYYLYSSGEMATGWINVNGKRYYLDDSGIMLTGWQKNDNDWYYLDQSGAMATGWIEVNNKRYYLDSSGVMQKGWIKIDGKWYYLNSSGAMQRGWIKVDNKWYYLDDSGVMLKGWLKLNNHWYYLSSSGAMETGWLELRGKVYYLRGSGRMVVGWLKVDDQWYYFNEDGSMARSTWIGKYYVDENGQWVR